VFSGNGIAVKDGSLRSHREDDPLKSIGVYGQTKALGESSII
jgi:dTDP-4-dehydrorhamnose reductase